MGSRSAVTCRWQLDGRTQSSSKLLDTCIISYSRSATTTWVQASSMNLKNKNVSVTKATLQQSSLFVFCSYASIPMHVFLMWAILPFASDSFTLNTYITLAAFLQPSYCPEHQTLFLPLLLSTQILVILQHHVVQH